jgi:Tol biopolymer transport system component
MVSVLPQGSLVASTYIDAVIAVVRVNLDGTGLTTLGRGGGISYPSATPNGGVLVHTGPGYATTRMQIIASNGTMRRVTTSDGLVGEAYGHFASDGWIYFSGVARNASFTVWRVRPDGSDLTQITSGGVHWHTSPSPDGRQVAFANYNMGGIQIVDVASRAIRTLVAAGDYPAWSPDGSRLAFQSNGAVNIVNVDGSGNRVLSPQIPGRSYDNGLAWSADGSWIVSSNASGPGPLVLINVASGYALPLSFSVGFSSPSFIP